MAGSVRCSVRRGPALLLNIIRQANVTDDEEDSTAEPPPTLPPHPQKKKDAL